MGRSRLRRGVLIPMLAASLLSVQQAAGAAGNRAPRLTLQYQASVKHPPTLASVACASPSVCVMVGDAGAVLRTADSGRHWIRTAERLRVNLHGVACTPQRTCVTVGDHGAILRSPDAGATWSVRRA